MRVVMCLMATTAVLGGCSDSTEVADCSTVIRYGDVIYRENGFTKVVDSEIGTASVAACDDTGSDAEGPFFPGNPEQVAVWSIPGRNAARVVAIEYSGDTYRVVKVLEVSEK